MVYGMTYPAAPWAMPLAADVVTITKYLADGRALMRSIDRVRRRLAHVEPLDEPALPTPDTVIEHTPVDVKHWLPNMPRGHEST